MAQKSVIVPTPKIYRYFIDPSGKVYKAEKAKSPDDMERLNVSQEQLDSLPDDGKPIHETHAKVIYKHA